MGSVRAAGTQSLPLGVQAWIAPFLWAGLPCVVQRVLGVFRERTHTTTAMNRPDHLKNKIAFENG